MTSEPKETMLRRDGHLSSLGLDRFLYEDLMPPLRRVVENHLAECEICAARVDEARETDATVHIPPMPADPESTRVVPLGRRIEVRAAAAVALAASLVVILWPTNPPPVDGPQVPPEIVRKGEGFTLNVLVDDGAGGRLLTSGDGVRPGDRLGFRVHAERAGHLMIVGIDETGDPYPCYPQDGTRAIRVQPSKEPIALDAAVELDDVPGSERIVGVLCPKSFDFSTIGAKLRATPAGGVPIDGCSTEEVVVVKSEVQ